MIAEDDPPLLRLEIGPVAAGGSCVARHEGRVVFVRHTLPGEVVLARLTHPTRTDDVEAARFWRADAVQVLQASPHRVVPPCPAAGPGGCGGCDWQHASLPAQRSGKAEVIREQLRRIARIEPPEVIVAPVGDQGGLGWRTRMRFAVDDRGRAGLREHRSHRVVPLSGCPIAHPDVAAVDVTGRSWPGAGAVEVCVGEGGDPLVLFEPAAPGERVKAPALPVPTSLARRDGSGVQRLRGRTWVEHRVRIDGGEVRFRVSEAGFWQVHPNAAQVLLDAVLDAASPEPGNRALDLYSGVGLFAMGLASRVDPDGSVEAVEADPRAISDAKRNLHDRPSVRLHQGPVDAVLPALLAAPASVDVVVLDPPRAGAGRVVMAAICAARPARVVYVACDPASLARDVALAREAGYGLSSLRAFDLFPMTHHVECVAVLEPDSAEV